MSILVVWTYLGVARVLFGSGRLCTACARLLLYASDGLYAASGRVVGVAERRTSEVR